jgi:hypothetical protein
VTPKTQSIGRQPITRSLMDHQIELRRGDIRPPPFASRGGRRLQDVDVGPGLATADTFLFDESLKEEIFGASSLLIRCRDLVYYAKPT